MRVEVRTAAGTHVGYCTIPESVWEPAWRTGYLHMFGPPDATELMPNNDPREPIPQDDPGDSNATRDATNRWTFEVATRHVDGSQPHHHIRVSSVASADILPDFTPNYLRPASMGGDASLYNEGLATGGVIGRPADMMFPTTPRDNSDMRLTAEQRARNAGRATLESNLLRDNPMFRVTPGRSHGLQAGDVVEVTGGVEGRQVHDSVIVEINQHSLTLEVAGELNLDTEAHADIARRIAARLDDEVLATLRNVTVNGEQVWERMTGGEAGRADGPTGIVWGARQAPKPTPMATTAAGKRAMEL